LGFAIAHLIDKQAPLCYDLPAAEQVLAEEIARYLNAARQPLIIAGGSHGEETLLQAAANIATALSSTERKAGLFLTFAECNSIGLALLGGKELSVSVEPTADVVIILENDLYRRGEDQLMDKIIDGADQVVVLDHIETATSQKATILLPAAAFAEANGTLVNNEGRAQRFFKVYNPQGDIQESWRWLSDIMLESGKNGAAGWKNLDDLLAELAQSRLEFTPVVNLAPDADFRLGYGKIPRQSHRYSGRTSMNATLNVSEPKPPFDPDSPFAFSMEGFQGVLPSGVIQLFWSPGWNSVQSVNKFQQEVGGSLHDGDPGIALVNPGRGKTEYYKEIPPKVKLDRDEWWIIPMHHIFGSEELSIKSGSLAQLAPQPYALINYQQGSRLHLKENDKILLQVNSMHLELSVRLNQDFPADTIGYPLGLKDLPYLDLPARGKIEGIRA
jgi:NADH-quinone oxidoreductase subunit G